MGGKRFAVVNMQTTEFIVVLFVNYCIIFYTNIGKPTFPPPCAY